MVHMHNLTLEKSIPASRGVSAQTLVVKKNTMKEFSVESKSSKVSCVIFSGVTIVFLFYIMYVGLIFDFVGKPLLGIILGTSAFILLLLLLVSSPIIFLSKIVLCQRGTEINKSYTVLSKNIYHRKYEVEKVWLKRKWVSTEGGGAISINISLIGEHEGKKITILNAFETLLFSLDNKIKASNEKG